MPSKKTSKQLILEEIFKSKHETVAKEMKADEYFEIFAAEQIMKDYGLDYQEITNGVIGNSNDGGIDAGFLIVNGILIAEDTKLPSSLKKPEIELHLIQAKNSPKLGKAVVKNWQDTFEDLFDLSKKHTEVDEVYNQDIIDLASSFITNFRRYLTKNYTLKISFYCVSKADKIHDDVHKRADKLIKKVTDIYDSADVTVELINAQRLTELYRKIQSDERALTYKKSLGTDEGSYVCLATLSDYYKFISSDDRISREIFDANVRDHQGNTPVNKDIRATLEDGGSDDFWYLNNGVTILTPYAHSSGGTIIIKDPQVVNGLQTSTEVFFHFKNSEENKADERHVLVRILQEENEKARDRIIRATNSQNSMSVATLRSSDIIHRDIEDYIKNFGYYYDRKKNKYKNEGRPADKIISLPYLSQIVMTLLLGKPDSARGRPSTLIAAEEQYQKIFSEKYSPDIYLNSVQLAERVMLQLKDLVDGDEKRRTTNNTKFYAMYLLVERLRGKVSVKEYLSSMEINKVTKAKVKKAVKDTLKIYSQNHGNDQFAKSSGFLTKVKSAI